MEVGVHIHSLHMNTTPITHSLTHSLTLSLALSHSLSPFLPSPSIPPSLFFPLPPSFATPPLSRSPTLAPSFDRSISPFTLSPSPCLSVVQLSPSPFSDLYLSAHNATTNHSRTEHNQTGHVDIFTFCVKRAVLKDVLHFGHKHGHFVKVS